MLRYYPYLKIFLFLVFIMLIIVNIKIISMAIQKDILPNQILKKSLVEKIDKFLRISKKTLKKKKRLINTFK